MVVCEGSNRGNSGWIIVTAATQCSRFSIIFFVTKYRYQVLKGDVGLRAREFVRETCEAFEIEMLKGVISKDHIHLLVSSPLRQTWSPVK